MKYPIGIQTFDQIRNEGFVYVDKTDLIYKLASEGKIYFLSRPRRFGKSLLVSTLKSYFEGKKELFRGLKIDGMETEWQQYPVFHIDFNGKNFTNAGELLLTITGYVETWESLWGKDPFHDTLGDRFAYVLHQAHEKTGRGCVVLVDEYDKPLLDVLDMPDTIAVNGVKRKIEDHNRELLKSFYSVFKLADADLRFVLLTGVTKFSQITVFSGFNQPNDISMSRDYEALCGITREELVSTFASSIHDMAVTLGYSDGQMTRLLRLHYDGYHFGPNLTDIYNPFSILNALSKQDLGSYWFQSGTPTYLIRLLNHTDENLNELTGKFYRPAQFVDYKADVGMPLPMIYQSGYLTIKMMHRRSNGNVTYKLDFPNMEVAEGFLTLVANSYLKSRQDSATWLNSTVDALETGDLSAFRDTLTEFLASIPYTARRHENERERERYFQYTVYLLMRMVSCYAVYHERETSQGRADCVVETDKYVYVFEYKLDRPATEAIAQIEAKGYAREYAGGVRKVYLIACCFSSKTGTVSDFLVKET